jgi:hypothetical protein
MTRVNRFDRGQIRAPVRTPQGYLKLDAVATRTGVFVYANPDGSIRRELRHPDEVFHPDSMASLAQVTVTDLHPPGLLDASNTAQYARGFTGETVTREDRFLTVPTVITDQALIADVEAKRKQETSCGYSCALVMDAGVFEGERYDARQTNIRYNHLAVVPRGRAGPDVRLRLDAAEQVTDSEGDHAEVPPVIKINIDGVEYEVSEAFAAAYSAQRRADTVALSAATERGDKAIADAKAATERADAIQAKLDAADEQLKARTDADLPAMVKARRGLERSAAKALPDDTKFDDMTDSQIKLAVIAAVSPEAKMDGKSEAYIDARFDAAIEVAESRTDSTDDLRKAAGDAKRSDAGADRADAARDNMIKRNSEAWKQPLNDKGGK